MAKSRAAALVVSGFVLAAIGTSARAEPLPQLPAPAAGSSSALPPLPAEAPPPAASSAAPAPVPAASSAAAPPAAAPPPAAPPSAPSSPEPLPASHFTGWLRSGISIPLGNSSGSLPLADTYGPQIPLVLDLGWRFDDRFAIGVYGGYGYALSQPDFECTQTGASCKSFTLRAGLSGTYRLAPLGGSMRPLLGAGLGWEVSRTTVDGPYHSTSAIVGPEAHLLVALDVPVSASFAIRPFVDVIAGAYQSYDISGGPGDSAGSTSFAIHFWPTAGVGLVVLP